MISSALAIFPAKPKPRQRGTYYKLRWPVSYACAQSLSSSSSRQTSQYNKQLLDEVEHDIMNYQTRGLCYLPKPKAEADNTDTRVLIIHDIMRKPNSINFVLFYIF